MLVSPEQQSRWNAIIIDVFRKFIEICKQNNLTYFCCGGTAIGAVRHNGIIPWDDDIDVFMPRPDYDAFLQLASKEDWGDYELKTPYNTCNYPMYFSKLCSKKTSLIEIAEHPFLMGLYIDIFPLDGASDSKDEAIRHQAQFRHVMNKLEAVSTHNTFVEYISLLTKPKEWGRFVRKTYAFFNRRHYRCSIIKQLDSICRHYDYATSHNVMAYSGSYGEREVFPKEWTHGIVEFPFESLTVNLFKGYDAYLCQLYGNYMQLPPVEKRVSHHYKAFFDLDKRVSFKDAIKAIKD